MKIVKKKKTSKSDSDKDLLPVVFWSRVKQQTHYLIADKLNEILPLASCRDRKIFNPNEDVDYQDIYTEVKDGYKNNLPNQDQASQEIAYEYLFLVVKSLIGKLKDFDCHKNEYLKKLF